MKSDRQKSDKQGSGYASQWLADARRAGLVAPAGLAIEAARGRAGEALLYGSSLREKEGTVFALLKVPGSAVQGPLYARSRALGVFGPAAEGFEGERTALGGSAALIGPLSQANAAALRRALPYTAPSPLADQGTTFGVGDRLGAATPGHLRVLGRYRIAPVLAQQSVRELDLTGRDYQQVLDACTWAVFQEGYDLPWGADGDHLKTEEWVRTALRVGFTMITADVSDYIRREHAGGSEAGIEKAYQALEESRRRRLEETYLPLSLELDTGESIRFSRETLARTALIYGEALEHALRLYRAGVQEKGEGSFDFELSVDETETPTTAEAHAFVALEARRLGMKVSSLAPRFVGEFQKGIDYIGQVGEFERTFATHAALARKFGYRLSVHSGSDKFSVFPAVGRLTRGCFHVKTAGTNWLEAVKTIAEREPQLYRRLHRAALERFAAATRYYNVSTDLGKVPALDSLSDVELPGLFDNPDSRQLIHITYGELLRDAAIGPALFSALQLHSEAYWQALEKHIGRHLDTLGVSLR